MNAIVRWRGLKIAPLAFAAAVLSGEAHALTVLDSSRYGLDVIGGSWAWGQYDYNSAR